MKKNLRIAMIGHQFMGRAHSNAWRQVGRFFDPPVTPVMKVVCGRDLERTRAAAEKLGWEEASTSWEEVVRRPDVDAVDICTPADLHLPIAAAAAAAGKAVLCEKPLARNLAEAEQMLAAVRRAGVVHMLCHNYRRVPAIALARQLITGRQEGEGDGAPAAARPTARSAASSIFAPSTCTTAESIRARRAPGATTRRAPARARSAISART